MLLAGRKIIASEGPKGLLTGFGPTAVGYLVQGGGKFAGYEYGHVLFGGTVKHKSQADFGNGISYNSPVHKNMRVNIGLLFI